MHMLRHILPSSLHAHQNPQNPSNTKVPKKLTQTYSQNSSTNIVHTTHRNMPHTYKHSLTHTNLVTTRSPKPSKPVKHIGSKKTHSNILSSLIYKYSTHYTHEHTTHIQTLTHTYIPCHDYNYRQLQNINLKRLKR